jgi:hypothetical protein
VSGTADRAPVDAGQEWQYTIRVGFADEYDRWVAQIVDDLGEELHVCHAATIGEVAGAAAVAIMDVYDDEDAS